jgi:hypothetical protein
MSQANLINEEAWRAAWRIVKEIESRFDDRELVETFNYIRAVVANAVLRVIERKQWEENRLNPLARTPATKSQGPTPKGPSP